MLCMWDGLLRAIAKVTGQTSLCQPGRGGGGEIDWHRLVREWPCRALISIPLVTQLHALPAAPQA